jgi:hypothetical protein
MVSLCTRSRPKDHTTAFTSELSYPLQLCSLAFFTDLFAAARTLLSAEPTLCLAVPDDERSHHIFVRGCPAVFEIDAWEGVMTGLVRVESLVLVEKIVLREQTRVDVAVPEIEVRYAFVMDVRQLFAYPASQNIAEDE